MAMAAAHAKRIAVAMPLLVGGLLLALLSNCDAVGERKLLQDPNCIRDPETGQLICPSGSGGCFPGDATVHLPGGRSKLMRELDLGDKVAVWEKATGRIVYDDVYAFGHKDASAVSEFVRIKVKADDSREPSSILELTSHHFVPTAQIPGKCEVASLVYRRAKDIAVGDYVWATNATGTAAHIVTEISSSVKDGLFNPFTLSGTIVVDGVVASVHSEWFLDGLFQLLGIVHSLPAAYQAVLSPVRLLYAVLLSKEIYIAAYNALDSRVNLAEFGTHYGGQVATSAVSLVAIFAALTFGASKKKLQA